MKTLKLSLLASLIFGLSVFSNANDNSSSHVENDEIKTSIMKVEKESLLVRVNKNTDELIKVEIKDGADRIIYTQIVKNNEFSAKYDFSKVADGTYIIVVSNASDVIASKKISIVTSREIAMK